MTLTLRHELDVFVVCGDGLGCCPPLLLELEHKLLSVWHGVSAMRVEGCGRLDECRKHSVYAARDILHRLQCCLAPPPVVFPHDTYDTNRDCGISFAVFCDMRSTLLSVWHSRRASSSRRSNVYCCCVTVHSTNHRL